MTSDVDRYGIRGADHLALSRQQVTSAWRRFADRQTATFPGPLLRLLHSPQS
jgi:hypothetical protein